MLHLLKNGLCLLILLSASHLSKANETDKEQLDEGLQMLNQTAKEQLVQGTLMMAHEGFSRAIAEIEKFGIDVDEFPTNNTDVFERNRTLAYLKVGRNFIQQINETFFPICNDSTNDKRFYDKPTDCSEVLANGNTENGLYSIWPRSRLSDGNPITVYCDMETDGGGWTVIQRRGNFSSQQDFYQNWEQYKVGFGDKEKDFWLGNDNIHALTNQAENEIRFDLQDANGEQGFAKYSRFWIDNEDSSYTLHIRNYTGNVGDCMKHHDNMKFATKDRGSTMFARFYKGGWWYSDWAHSNLNGRFTLGKVSIESVHWWYWRQNKGLAGVEIKVRPR